MDGTLWEKVEQFLYQMHYEDTDRESHYESKAYLAALQNKEAREQSFLSGSGMLKTTKKAAEILAEMQAER